MERRDFMKLTSGGAAGVLASTAAIAAPSRVATEEIHPVNSGLPYRQIHLDYHTSRHIEGIGAEFDPDEFVNTLKQASVNSITCFGRCHHGFMYYDTDKFTERRHPHLTKNVLNEQIEACHKNNIRVPIYVTIQWDYYTSTRYSEWLMRDADGKPIGNPIYEPGFYQRLCVNSPYRQFLIESITEMFEKVPVDGLFLDIVKDFECSCKYCRAGMEQQGYNAANAEDRYAYYSGVMREFKAEFTDFIKKLDANCAVFYNGGHIGPDIRNTITSYSHLELESLPSGSWGYLHFPLTSRYARNLGKEILGMTGKFHTAWGDFHSFKNQAALEFECFNMLAMGARCSVGDQLLPSGKIDQATYELIGSVYNQVEKKEPWCYEAKPVVDIAVFSPEEFLDRNTASRVPDQAKGAVRMLQEANHQFDIVDSKSDLSAYKVVILPDTILADDQLAAKIDGFASKGGSVVATFESGLDKEKNDFELSCLGVQKVSDGPIDEEGALARGKMYGRNNFVEYIIPTGTLAQGLNSTEYTMYAKGLTVKSDATAEVLISNTNSYFDRTYDYFCSHRQTPSGGKSGSPAIIKNGKCLYFSHPIFTGYNQRAPKWYKQLFLNALNLVLPDAAVKVEGPSTINSALNIQENPGRLVLHLLHYIPESRGLEFDTIEDVIPVYNIKCSVRNERNYSRARLVPENKALKTKRVANRMEFVVPEIKGHQMVEIS
jgi:hypothetical protein